MRRPVILLAITYLEIAGRFPGEIATPARHGPDASNRVGSAYLNICFT